MKMSELQSKDIVNTKDGKKIGRIVDLVVDEKGFIEYLVIEPAKMLKRYTQFLGDTNVKFNQIVKFGSDVILVELD